jgi:cysteine desulfurase
VRIYADHAATTPLSDVAWQAMEPFLRSRFGNPSEPHWAGREARAGLDQARRTTAAALGCEPADVVFTAGGSESDNLAVLGRAAAGTGRLTASAVEHPAVREPLLALAAGGRDVAVAPVGADGIVDLDRLAELVRPGDALCAVMWAGNVTGAVQPVAAIAELCAERGVPLHLDAVQAAASVRVDLSGLPGTVTASVSAHKLGGPKGAGVLAGSGVRSLPAVLRGGGQERGLRPGTESVANAAGLAAALEAAQSSSHADRARIRDAYEAALLAAVPDASIASGAAERLPGHSLALLPGLRGDTLVALLDDEEIAVAAGSACAAGEAEPSYVLAAMGVERELALGALRVTFGALSEPSHADVIARAVGRAASALRRAAAAV